MTAILNSISFLPGGVSNYSLQLSGTDPTFSDPLVPCQSPDKTSLVLRVCQQSPIPLCFPHSDLFPAGRHAAAEGGSFIIHPATAETEIP